ncbi:MAG: hypothetical protein B7Z69_08035 [Actinobacteria bacterium 21-73-9]|nr:MAG: hypothetical protein B7Z69_08035 [Actinobacteria bacterium 21-73-9]
MGTVLGLFVVAVGLIIWVLMGLLTPGTPEGVVNFVGSSPAGQPVNMTIQTVGSIGYGNHPTWVSYLVKTPQGKWIQDTTWQLPANTQINVTVLQYDSGSPLRNQEFGQVTGTTGNVATLNGTSYSSYNSNAGNGVGHTFTVPSLGLSVPLVGVNGNLSLCGVAPCSVKQPHNTITFSFKTPAKTGEYHWQCFVPCGLGYLYGNGGPMSTQGFMGGFLDVVQQ